MGVSNYLSELSYRSANTRADLAKSERQIQRIEAELRQNNKPTSQSANNRNHRAKQDKNKKLGVEYVTSMDTQKKTVSHHAGIANFQDIAIEIVLKEVTEEEAKAEEEKE